MDSGSNRMIPMLAYEIYTFNNLNGYELIGILPERRQNLMRITKDSILKWGKIFLGDNTDNNSIYFKKVTLDDKGRIFWVNMSNN